MQGNTPSANLFPLAVSLFGEVQRVLGRNPVRSLRVKFGNQVIKEIPISPLTQAATVAVVLLAVVVSTLSVEIEHEPAH